MDGPHDLGGTQGFGPIEVDPNEPVFTHGWERKVFGLTMATSTIGMFNRDENRYARERMPADAYRDTGYFEQWLVAMETNLIERGVLDARALRERVAEILNDTEDSGDSRAPVDGPERPELVELFRDTLEFGAALDRKLSELPAFEVGQRVRARKRPAKRHTRLPGYVRGHVGIVRRVDPAFVLPDTNAHLEGESPEHTYSVAFSARDLWGDRADENDTVLVDVWESYLEPIN